MTILIILGVLTVASVLLLVGSFIMIVVGMFKPDELLNSKPYDSTWSSPNIKKGFIGVVIGIAAISIFGTGFMITGGLKILATLL